jgi:hypothetical protein
MKCTNKDVLLGLVMSLSDSECKDVYYFIMDKEYKNEYIEFDNVMLTQRQYNKLVNLWGKDKVTKCIDILSEWLKIKNITKRISHYRQLVGWVERKYYQLYPANDKSIINCGSIDTKWKAIKYIKQIPKDQRAYDSDVIFLTNKYGLDAYMG